VHCVATKTPHVMETPALPCYPSQWRRLGCKNRIRPIEPELHPPESVVLSVMLAPVERLDEEDALVRLDVDLWVGATRQALAKPHICRSFPAPNIGSHTSPCLGLWRNP
jgi:hypothetical protein